MPGRAVGHGGDAGAAGVGGRAVAQHAIGAVKALGLVPRAIVVGRLHRIQQLAALPRHGLRQQRAGIAVVTQSQRCNALGQAIKQPQARHPGRAEVALIGKVGPLFVADAVHQLGNEPVQIAVAMAMRVRGHVHRHAVHIGGEVGAMVQVKAAQKVLVGLAITTVLGDDHAGHKLQHFGRAQRGTVFDQLGGDHTLAGRVRRANGVVIGALNGDRGEFLSACWQQRAGQAQ